MKKTLTVLFVIAMIIASTQTFRHVYVKWIAPTHSVLDQFTDQQQQDIEAVKSLDELADLYQEAHQKVQDYEANSDNPVVEYRNKKETEPYRTESQVKQEIQNREYDKNQLSKLSFYWLSGLFSVALGIFVFIKVNAWLGFSGLLVGFSEMLCWTSPLFHNRMNIQFELLLNFKLLLSVITWALLVALWLLIDKYKVVKQLN